MKNIIRVCGASLVALVWWSAAASAQVGVAPPPASLPASGAFTGGISAPDLPMDPTEEAPAKPAAPVVPKRTPHFNRVTTTRTQIVPAPSPGAARSAPPGPFEARALNERARAANSGIPAGSTWRRTAPPSRPPATSVQSATRNYYPGMRPSVHPNADQAQVRARSGQNRLTNGMMAGGMSGSGARPAARPGMTAIPSHRTGPALALPRR
jgi:hypothetical protein